MIHRVSAVKQDLLLSLMKGVLDMIGTPSHQLTFDEAIEVWLLHWQGEFKNRIAAKFDVNVWRIYDVIKYGRLHIGSEEAAAKIWAEKKTAA